MIIRLANIDDVQQLYLLNQDFNGKEVVAFDLVKERLEQSDEIVVVAQESGELAGFVCAQVMKSFCYNEIYAEITEVFVSKKYRRKGCATKMLEFTHRHCAEKYQIEKFQLFTDKFNRKAKKLYESLGYTPDSAQMYRKR